MIMTVQALITRCEREYQRRAKLARIGSQWRKSHSIVRGTNGSFFERNPRNPSGIQGPYRSREYGTAWWVTVLACLAATLFLIWLPAGPAVLP